MKKLHLIYLFIFIMHGLFAQLHEIEKKPEKIYFYPKFGNNIKEPKAGGDVLWAENFDAVDWAASININTNLLENPNLMPDGWVVYDGNGNDFYWHWSMLGPRGKFSGGLTDSQEEGNCNVPNSDLIIQSLTSDNGFMMLESDYFNTDTACQMINPPFQIDSYIMTPALDFTGSPGAHLKWQQFFRYCCWPDSRFIVAVSTDYNENNPGSAHWTEFDAFYGTTPVQMSENPQNAKIDLTNFIAGQSNVRIRWHQTGGSHYFWIIDDIEITEPYAYDLVLTNKFADYLNVAPNEDFENNKPGGYYYIPKNQLGSFKEFRAVIANQGLNSQSDVRLDLKVVKNNMESNPIWEASSETGIINFGQSDTFKIMADYMLPEKIGKYSFIFEAVGQQMDFNDIDNLDRVDVYVTDSIYSRSRLDLDGFTELTTGDWFGGDYDGAMVGVLFSFPHDAVLNSMNFYFPKRNDSILVQNGNFSYRCHIYEANLDSIVNSQALYTSPMYTLHAGDRGNFVSVPLSDSTGFAVSAGKYYAVLECFTNTENGNNHIDFYIGQDKRLNNSIYDDGFSVTIFKPIDFSWGNIPSTPAIYLNIEGTKTQMTKIVFDLNMGNVIDFNSNTDSIFVFGSFNEFEYKRDYLTQVGYNNYSTVKYFPRGDLLQWKYAFYTPNEDVVYESMDYRQYTGNHFSMTTHDRWDHGYFYVVDIRNEVKQGNEFLYPNPTNKVLNLSNLPVYAIITIFNPIGSAIYKQKVCSQKHTLDVSGFENGIYIVEIRNSEGKRVMQRFIKQ